MVPSIHSRWEYSQLAQNVSSVTVMASHNQCDEEVLRASGQRLTPQRRIVLDVMQRAEGHVDADHVEREAHKSDPRISTASIYRILAWLSDQGLVSVTDIGGRDHVYEYLGRGRHHHLVCRQCGTQTEVPFDFLAPLIDRVRQTYGFEVHVDHQAIFGTCGQCNSTPSLSPYEGN